VVDVVRSALSSRRAAKWLPWISAALLAAGVIAFLVVYFGNTANTKETFGSGAPVRPHVTKEIPLARGARETVGKFILTAVARQHLDEAWRLVTPSIKGGLTFKEWMTGDIPVPAMGVPIAKAAITKIIYSHRNDAEINVVLLPKPNKEGVKDTLFVVDLKKVAADGNAHWLVDYCQAQASIPLPTPS
jgi:hypothetical protein